MWLIDAAQINVGGAISILEMVLTELENQEIEYLLIKDKRLTNKRFFTKHHVEPDYPILRRKRVYREVLKSNPITRIISLISIPPPFRSTIPTHTYFHNVNLLHSARISNASRAYKYVQRLKHTYITQKLKNTDYYAFQSKLIQSDFLSEFDFDEKQCSVFPFYQENTIKKIQKEEHPKDKNHFIYISADYPHKNHKRLLKAWEILGEEGHYPMLTITVPDENDQLIQVIEQLISKGIRINNIGVVDHETCLTYTAKASYCIFPSMSESLGLGLVESQMLGNKILVSDLPYAFQAVKPSAVFNPEDTTSIVDVVKQALSNTLESSELRMDNSLKDWIQFIENSHI